MDFVPRLRQRLFAFPDGIFAKIEREKRRSEFGIMCRYQNYLLNSTIGSCQR